MIWVIVYSFIFFNLCCCARLIYLLSILDKKMMSIVKCEEIDVYYKGECKNNETK